MKIRILCALIIAFLPTAIFAWEYDYGSDEYGDYLIMPGITVGGGGGGGDPHWGIPAGAGDPPTTPPTYENPGTGDGGGISGGGGGDGGGGGGGGGGGSAASQLEADKRLLTDAAFFSKYGYPKNADLLNSKWFPKQSNSNSCVSAASSLAVNTVTTIAGNNAGTTESTFLQKWAQVTGDPQVGTGEKPISADSLTIHGESILNQYVNVTSLPSNTSLANVVGNLNSTNVAMVTIQGEYGGVMTHEIVIQKSAGGTINVYDSALGFSYNTTVDSLQPMYDAARQTAQSTISTLPPMIVNPKS